VGREVELKLEGLTPIATAAAVEMPKTRDRDHQKVHDQLQSTHGKAFDPQYMRAMAEDHDQAIKLFHQEVSLGHDPLLKQFAHKILPTIEEHHKMALDLSHRLSETAAR
jgi:putative membrane protein